MNETIVWYSRLDYRNPWPKAIVREFGRLKSESETFTFVYGSPFELDFRNYYDPRTMIKLNFVRCDQYGITQHQYFYLSVRTADVCSNYDFLEEGSACKIDEPPICWYNTRQVRPAMIDIEQMGKLDIVEDAWCHYPRVIIVSQRCKDILERENVTGCEFLTCRQQPEKSNSERFECYQLKVTGKVNRGVNVGTILNVSGKCDVCGAIKTFWSTEVSGYFNSDDLLDVDFQTSSTLCTDDGEEYDRGLEYVIVSSRVLNLLVSNKVSGVNKYLEDPDVPYRALDIR